MLTADIVAGFAGSLLQKSFDGAVDSPACHHEWWELFCSDHPQVAIAAPRGHAKTTALSHTYTLASVCFREREYVLIVSDTISQAVQFLGDIKKELAENEQLRNLFKIKEFVKETEDDVIVACEDGHLFRISAKGSEQKVRGLKWNNKRPDLIICDDLENDEIVLNKERRLKFKRWFYAALLPCKSYKGIIRYVGTILHADSLLESVMPKMSKKTTKQTELKIWSEEKRPPWIAVKYKAHNPDFSELLWPERYNKQFFIDKRNDMTENGMADGYSQEYLNIPIDESVSYFRRSDFKELNELDIKALNEPDWKKYFNFYIGTDLAVSQNDQADWSVFVIAAMNESGHLYVLKTIRERMDSQQIVTTLLGLQRVYNPMAISIEKGQIEKSIGPFLRQQMLETNTFLNLIPLAPSVDKMTRARSMQARMRAGGVKFDKRDDSYFTLEDECLLFPRGKHDDQVDALSYIGLIIDKLQAGLSKQEVEDEEDHEEYMKNLDYTSGRSQVTGY